MKKTLVALTITTVFTALPMLSHAEDTNPLSFNLSLTSDYRYRGISQTRLDPALQGGADYAAPNGLYVGTWLSTIRWINDAGGDADVEWDVYGGYKGALANGLGYDVGVLAYQYPSNHLHPSADTTEVYGALSFGPATVKYSHSVTNLFGFSDSKNSGYLDLSASFDLGGGFSLAPHVGYQKVAHHSDASYTDYALTLSKEVAGFGLSAAVVGADTKRINGVKAYASPANGKDLGRAGLVLAVRKTF